MQRFVHIIILLLLAAQLAMTCVMPPKIFKNPSHDVVVYRQIGDPLDVYLTSPRPGTPVASCEFGYFGDYYLAANLNSDEWNDRIIYIGNNKTCSIKLERITEEFFGEWTIWTVFDTTTQGQCEIYSDKLSIYPSETFWESVVSAFKSLFGFEKPDKRLRRFPGPTSYM